MNSDLRLAANWPISKVRRCLRKKDRDGLVQFLRERHDERFFKPIRYLKGAPGNIQGYGFAMMALCALLVETIQSYRDGLPTTLQNRIPGCCQKFPRRTAFYWAYRSMPRRHFRVSSGRTPGSFPALAERASIKTSGMDFSIKARQKPAGPSANGDRACATRRRRSSFETISPSN